MARAASVFRWRGTTSGAYDTPGNWIKADGSVWDSYPGRDVGLSAAVDGDTVLMDGVATNALLGGVYTGATVGDLAAFKVTDSYKDSLGNPLDIGSEATPLSLDMQTTGTLVIEGTNTGDIWVTGGGTNGLAEVTVLATKNGKIATLNGAIRTLNAFKGNIALGASAAISVALRTGYLNSQGTDVQLSIPSTATLPATVEIAGGVITSAATVTTLSVTGGKWNQSTNSLTTVKVWNGLLIWNSGNIATLDIFGGMVDGSQSNAARTVTTARVFFGGTLRLDNGTRTIVATNPIEVQGGSVMLSPGTKIAIS